MNGTEMGDDAGYARLGGSTQGSYVRYVFPTPFTTWLLFFLLFLIFLYEYRHETLLLLFLLLLRI
jgi:hypothetical protein